MRREQLNPAEDDPPGRVCAAGGHGRECEVGWRGHRSTTRAPGPPRVGTAGNCSAFLMEQPRGVSFTLPGCSLSYSEGPSGTGNLIISHSKVSGPCQRRSPKPQAASHGVIAFSFGWPEWRWATAGHHPARNNPPYVGDGYYVTLRFAPPC